MRSSFSGLDIAYRALQAQQQAIDVINQNIANANTPGYSRQVAHLATTPPYTMPTFNRDAQVGQMGTGVAVVDIARVRLSFIDYQIRGESQALGQWEKMRDALQQVGVVFNEPSDSGLNSLLSKFWQAWQDVANSPQSAASRTALIEQADSLATAFARRYAQLTAIQQDLDRQIGVDVNRLNELAQRIATLNVRIAQVETVGQRANDLRDQRDLLLDELSKLVKVSYVEAADGSISVFLGNRQLVSRDAAETVLTRTDIAGYRDIVWGDGSAVAIDGGELYGLQQARDTALPKFIADLQALAGQLITNINAAHAAGYGLDDSTGLSFFTGTGADDIAVSATIKANPGKIAAAGSPGSPGDNSVALNIARLQGALTMQDGTVTFGDFFASMIARLGVDAQRAEVMAGNQGLLVDHLIRQKDSQSGVSLDEETTQLIAYQRAYEAAARVVNIVDEMLDKLINGTGQVGR